MKYLLASRPVVFPLPGLIVAHATLAGSVIILQMLLNKNLPPAVPLASTLFGCLVVLVVIAAGRLLPRLHHHRQLAFIGVVVNLAAGMEVVSASATRHCRDIALALLTGMHDQAAPASMQNRPYDRLRSFLPKRVISFIKFASCMAWLAPLRHSVVSQASRLGY